MRGVNVVKLLGCAALAAWAACPTPVLANDSSAELSVGGLVFTRNADVSIESEDLTITPDTVTVRYRFLNQTASPVTVTVAFPLPEIDLSDPDTNYAFPTNDPVNFVGFQTKVDGKPVNFTIQQRALLNGKDVTDKLRATGMALLPIGPQSVRFNELPDNQRKQLVDGGFILPSGTNVSGQPIYVGTWTVKTTVVRQQTFPVGQPVLVEHTYRTSVGMSFDTVLRDGLRRNPGVAAQVQRYRANYCILEDFLRSVDRLAGSLEANTQKLQERRISYVLTTGANWSGPIKDFHLVVDKGKPDRIVSFCGDNIKKISPTQFEIRMKDYTPDRDLRIIIVGKS